MTKKHGNGIIFYVLSWLFNVSRSGKYSSNLEKYGCFSNLDIFYGWWQDSKQIARIHHCSAYRPKNYWRLCGKRCQKTTAIDSPYSRWTINEKVSYSFAFVPLKSLGNYHWNPCVDRKLKNREAAQTARDRKRERMCQLEDEVKILMDQNQELQDENTKLRLRTG